MLEIWMDDDNDAKVRIAVVKSYQQFETMTYHFLLRSSGCSHFLHFLLDQDSGMLEIWMDDNNNDTKVRIAEDMSY